MLNVIKLKKMKLNEIEFRINKINVWKLVSMVQFTITKGVSPKQFPFSVVQWMHFCFHIHIVFVFMWSVKVFFVLFFPNKFFGKINKYKQRSWTVSNSGAWQLFTFVSHFFAHVFCWHCINRQSVYGSFLFYCWKRNEMSVH